MYLALLRQQSATLGNLDAILGKAVAYAEGRRFDPNNYLGLRLAPDMLPFAVQIRIACDSAKGTAANLSGKEAPRHEDTETTLAELRARIGLVREFVDSVTEADLAGVDPTRLVTVPAPKGKALPLLAYVVGRQIPNFYFHIAMTYALLRKAGVEIGKTDYLGALPLVDA